MMGVKRPIADRALPLASLTIVDKQKRSSNGAAFRRRAQTSVPRHRAQSTRL